MKKIILLFCVAFLLCPTINADNTKNMEVKNSQIDSSDTELSDKKVPTELVLLKERNKILEHHNSQLMSVLWSAIAIIAAFLGAGFFFYRSQIQNERTELKLLLKSETENMKISFNREIETVINSLFQKTESQLIEKEKELENKFHKQIETLTEKNKELNVSIKNVQWQSKKELQQSFASLHHYQLKDYKNALKSYIWVLKYMIHLKEHQSEQYVEKEMITMTLESIKSILSNDIDLKEVEGSDIRELDNILNQLPGTYEIIKKKIQSILLT